MSARRLNSIRKRRSDDEPSDDSDEDLPPVKKQRACNGETSMFPLSLLYIKQVVSSKCHNIFKWITDLPLKNYFKQNLMASFDIIGLDDEIKGAAIPLDEKDIEILNNEADSALAISQVGESSYFRGSSNGFREPFTSTPVYTDGTLVGLRPNVVSSMNGYHSKGPNPKSNLKNPQKQPKSRNRCYAPITNPRTDFEILLEMDDPDDLRPVSHTSNEERPSELSRQTVSQVSMFDSTPMDGSSSITKKKSFTANEVVRLQEKAKYQQLLEKMMRNPLYVPVKPKTSPIEVDLTNDEDEKTTVFHFKKKTLHLPIDELYEKYYKSCQLFPIPCSPRKQPPQRNEDTGLVAQRNKDAGLLAQRNEDAGLLAQRNEDAGLLAQRNKDAGPRSQPLPLYRPKAKYKVERTKPSFFTAEWLRELKSSIIEETEECMQRVRQEEHVIKRHQARREARFAEEKRRLNLCRIPGDVFPEPSSGKDEFPELTTEMEKMVEAAYQHKTNDVLVCHNDMKITCEMLRTLSGANWLMDEVINFYFNLIVERSKLDNTLPSVYVFSTFFYASMNRRDGMKSVLRWTRKVDIFSYDFLLIPLHLDVHWALVVVDNHEKVIRYYDSMSNTGRIHLESIRGYLVSEMKDKKKIDMNPDDYSLQSVGNLPRQLNGSDCGMFALRFAEYISRKANINFNQGHMNYFRCRTAYEILTKKLL